jgi:glutathione S-transferase
MSHCAGIKADGGRCGAQAIRGSEWCFNHHPDYEEQRRRRASRGGRRGGRGRPVAELSELKRRFEGLATDVLSGEVDRADAAVAGQLLNYAVRAVAVGLKAKEVEELEARLEELESAIERQDRRGAGWG